MGTNHDRIGIGHHRDSCDCWSLSSRFVKNTVEEVEIGATSHDECYNRSLQHTHRPLWQLHLGKHVVRV